MRGPDAGAVLDRLSAGAVNQHDGVITYTQWLGEDGGIRADLVFAAIFAAWLLTLPAAGVVGALFATAAVWIFA